MRFALFVEHKSNIPELILHLEDLATELEGNDTALCHIVLVRLCLQDSLADLLQEGHSARAVVPRLGLEVEDLVNPRTCGRLQVQVEEVHMLLIAFLSGVSNILNVTIAKRQRNYLAVQQPMLLQGPVSHDGAEGTWGQKGLEESATEKRC